MALPTSPSLTAEQLGAGAKDGNADAEASPSSAPESIPMVLQPGPHPKKEESADSHFLSGFSHGRNCSEK